MSHPLESSVLRILDPQKKTVGTGFLVAPGLAVTCAHVVEAAKSGPGQPLTLADFAGQQPCTAVVLEQGWSPSEQNDLAFLRIQDEKFAQPPVQLSTAAGRASRPYIAVGFPPDPTYGSDTAQGNLGGLTPVNAAGRAAVLQFQGAEIRPGMSGAPVLDVQAGQVVGMVCEYQTKECVRRAYGVTADTIAAACPEDLTLRPFTPPPSPEEIQAALQQILKILQSPNRTVSIPDSAQDAIHLSGGNLSISFSLQDTDLLSVLTPRLNGQKNLDSYLLWLTALPTYNRWATQYIALQGQMDLPVTYTEVQFEGPGQERRKTLPDITQAVREHPAFVLLGEPGCGKTTTLEKIAFEHARARLAGEDARIPLFVRLAAQRKASPEDFLKKEWEKHTGLPFADALRAGQLLILADGVNEIARAARQGVLTEWKRFTREALEQGNQVVFSARIKDYDAELSLPRVDVDRLDPERVREYLARHDSADLLQELHDPDVWELAENPFYLMMLVAYYRQFHEIPRSRAVLMREFTRNLIRRELERMPDCELTRAAVEGSLIQLAYTMQDQGVGTTFAAAQARAALPRCVENEEGENEAVDPAAVLRLGRGALLLDPATKPDVRFYHHLLQEYFAAHELLRRFSAEEDLSNLWLAPRLAGEMPPPGTDEWEPLPEPLLFKDWAETTLLAAGLAAAPCALIEAVRRVNPALAGRCLVESGLQAIHPLRLGGLAVRVETDQAEMQRLLDGLRADLLADLYDPRLHLRARLQAGRVLGQLGDPRLKIDSRDGVRFIAPDLVPIPGGIYTFGASKYDPLSQPDERPPFKRELPPFSAARRPVTNAEYACFIAAGGYREPRYWEGDLAQRWLQGEDVTGGPVNQYLTVWEFTHQENWRARITWEMRPKEMQVFEAIASMEKEELLEWAQRGISKKSRVQPSTWQDEGWNFPNQPVTGLTWFEARAYCAWISEMTGKALRLPDEFEWEAAARGLEGRLYPWGREWDPAKANTLEGRVQRPSPVGAYAAAQGLGPGGIEDQAGNVWEWTESRYTENYVEVDIRPPGPEEEGLRVLRGGSWSSNHRDARCAYRGRNVPDDFYFNSGFRLFSPGLFLDSDR